MNNNSKYKNKNDKWVQIYSDFFIAGKDYVEISYNWTEGVTLDNEVIKIYNKINKLYKYYEKNKDEYLKISKSAKRKANLFNNNICDKTYQFLIINFINKIYENNNNKKIDIFLDELIKLDSSFIINNIK